MLRLSDVGPSVLGVMATAYALPSITHHLLQRKPPGIISLTYTFMTACSIIFGSQFISSDTFLIIVNEASSAIFKGRVADAQSDVLIITIFLSICFILGNLLRSYFNLHRIEDSTVIEDNFNAFISGLEGISRWVEFSFRSLIFFSILMIEYEIVLLKYTNNQKVKIDLRAKDFLITYNLIWFCALIFYFFLLIWDSYLLWCLRNDSSDRKKENKATIISALPVHCFGFLVALCITLPTCNYFAYYSSQCYDGALILSISGIVFLFISFRKDIKLIKAAFVMLFKRLYNLWSWLISRFRPGPLAGGQ